MSHEWRPHPLGEHRDVHEFIVGVSFTRQLLAYVHEENAVNSYMRQRLREDSVFTQILPPTLITSQAELEREFGPPRPASPNAFSDAIFAILNNPNDPRVADAVAAINDYTRQRLRDPIEFQFPGEDE